MTSRNKQIDIAKGIGILLIVFGHNWVVAHDKGEMFKVNSSLAGSKEVNSNLSFANDPELVENILELDGMDPERVESFLELEGMEPELVEKDSELFENDLVLDWDTLDLDWPSKVDA